jgi:hypothetical protein
MTADSPAKRCPAIPSLARYLYGLLFEERKPWEVVGVDRGSDTKTVEFADCDTRTVFLLGRSATVERQLDESSSSLYATCTPSPYMLRPLYLV